MAPDLILVAHNQWIDDVQPVVSPQALLAAQVVASQQVSEPQQRFRSLPARSSSSLSHPLPEYGKTP